MHKTHVKEKEERKYTKTQRRNTENLNSLNNVKNELSNNKKIVFPPDTPAK